MAPKIKMAPTVQDEKKKDPWNVNPTKETKRIGIYKHISKYL
jgi:hypothetical protein